MDWLSKNSSALQALGNIITAIVAIAALVGVKLQIDAADHTQRSQSARDIYREFLNLSIQNPKLAKANWCALTDASEKGAYEAYIEYLLYTAEQAVEVDPSWRPAMEGWMAEHRPYLCNVDDWSGYGAELQSFIREFTASHCAEAAPCGP